MTTSTSRLQALLRAEAAGGLTLSVGMVVALLWSGWAPDHYHDFWHHHFGAPTLSSWHLGTPHDIVANAVLTIFFFGVGLELARELRHGHLRVKKNALMPALAALGGMVATALFAVTLGYASGSSDLAKGWGVPMATDIAFALGALALVGKRIPRELRIFLLTLAIVDDVLSVIALALSDPTKIRPLYLALLPATVFLLSFKSRQRLVVTMMIRVVATWMVLAAANVEPCLAGAIVGLVAPFGSNSEVTERLEHRVVLLATWIALPLFALTACGIDWRSISWSNKTWTFIGLMAAARLVGKIVGIVGVVTLASRFGLGSRPGNTKQVASLASLCAVGFTVPLLFAEQAYGAANASYFQTTAALLGVSVLAAVVGCAGLWTSGSSTKGSEQ